MRASGLTFHLCHTSGSDSPYSELRSLSLELMSAGNSPKVALLVNHISRLLAEHRAPFDLRAAAAPTKTPLSPRPPPLFIALQGPQGIGKTTLTNSLVTALSSEEVTSSAPNSRPGTSPDSTHQGDGDGNMIAKLAVLSLDDFYLPHTALDELATSSKNVLFQGRGLPGTHDVPLLRNVLESLYHINDVDDEPTDSATSGGLDTPLRSVSPPRSANIPRYDKSAYDGQGDRESEASVLTGPLDVVLLEGWCMGFYPVSDAQLQRTWDHVVLPSSSDDDQAPERALQREIIQRLGVPLADIEQINELLGDYADYVYPYFTGGFVQVSNPSRLHCICEQVRDISGLTERLGLMVAGAAILTTILIDISMAVGTRAPHEGSQWRARDVR